MRKGGNVVSSQVVEYPAIWVTGAACSGCSISFLNSVSPTIKNLLIDPVLPGKHISLRFHTTVMAGQGEPAVKVMIDTSDELPGEYLLLVEGSIQTAEDGHYCTAGERKGDELLMTDVVADLATDALAVIGVGTCASFGGIPAGAPNPTGATSVAAFMKAEHLSKPLINVPGCPPHPAWLVGTIASILLKGLPSAEDLDAVQRPKAFYGTLIHDNCPRRAFFDAGQFAQHSGEPGCLYELGCKGPVTYADCPIRHWNNGVNWCIGAGGPCIGCVEPGFPDRLQPMFLKIGEEELERFVVRTR
jgi:hydrogenase small subunit